MFILRCRQYAEQSKKSSYKMAAHIGQNLEIDAKKAMKGKTQPFTAFRQRIASSIGSNLMRVKPTDQAIEAAKEMLGTPNIKKAKKEKRTKRIRVEWTPATNPYLILRYTDLGVEGKKRSYRKSKINGKSGKTLGWKPKKGQRDWVSVRYLAKALTVRKRMFSTGFLGGQLGDGSRSGTQIQDLKRIASSKSVITNPRTIHWQNYNISKRAPREMLSIKGIEYVSPTHSEYRIFAHAAFLKDGERTYNVLTEAVRMSTENLEKSPYIKKLKMSNPTNPDTL